jgi:hypothetical protein
MNYSTLSLSELKALAIENNVIPTIGKRSARQTWIDALELFAASEAISDEIHSPIEDEIIDFDEMMAWCDNYIADVATKSLELPSVATVLANASILSDEQISDTDMEAIAHNADMAKEIIDRLEELSVEPDNETEAEFEARSGEYIGLSEVLGDIQTEIKAQSSKKGAATVIVTLLCAIAIIIRSTFTIASAAIRACIHLTSMFGRYNPNYDLWYQLQLLIEQRKQPLIAAPAQ